MGLGLELKPMQREMKKKTEALYIKYRVQTLHDAVHANYVLTEELAKEAKKDSYIDIPKTKKTPTKKVAEITNTSNYDVYVVEVIKKIEADTLVNTSITQSRKDFAFAKSAILQGDINYIKANSNDFTNEAINQLIEYSDLCGEYKILTYLTSLSNFNRESINADTHHVEGITNTEELVTLIEDNAPLKYLEQSLASLTKEETLSIINSADACKEYPLHVAVKNKRVDIVECLLKKGANKNQRNSWGRTPLELATKMVLPEAEKILK